MGTMVDAGRWSKGLVGQVAGYEVLVAGDAVPVGRGGEQVVTRAVVRLATTRLTHMCPHNGRIRRPEASAAPAGRRVVSGYSRSGLTRSSTVVP